MRLARLVPVLLLTIPTALRGQLVPHKQPGAGELVDSAAFAVFVRAHAGETRGTTELSLVFDSTGSLKSARAVEGSLTAAVQGVLADSLSTYVRSQAPWSGGTWWVRLSVATGPEVALRTGRCRVQPPTLASTRDIASILAAGGNSPAGRIDLRFLVNEEGRVLRAEAGPGTAGLSPLATARLREGLHFSPGTVDSLPQPMWIGVRLEFAGVRVR